MKKRFFGVLILAISLSAIFYGFNNTDYFKINKSFEIFGTVFREISNNYVLEIEPEIMIKNGINGMLSTLDPYTEFYTEEFAEDMDILTEGIYTGFGFTISQIDNQTTIIGLNENNSAYRKGLRIGDRIYQIDTAVVLNISSDLLKKYTRGTLGSSANVKIIREGRSDTLSFVLTRENINLPNISYFGVTENNIGYIKIESFTKNSPGEVRNAFMQMKNETDLKGLILDFRYNPGGLLSSAIGIVELFVPKGSVIVSTRGKNKNEDFEYVSLAEPIEPNLPLAVIINSSSASASEIVAGAIQDLDRGVIIGQRSFGKGLVQSIFDMPYNTYLKMTTAKYYTPSGRCIQKLKFGELYNRREVTPNTDTTIFYTKNGRKVYELTGILPDTIVEIDTMSYMLGSLFDNDLMFNFATYYSSRFDSISKNFEVNDKIFGEFEKYIKNKEYTYLSPTADYLREIDKIMTKTNYPKQVINNLKSLKKSIEKEDKKDLRKYKKEISQIIRYEILRRFHPESYILKESLSEDKDFKTANSILSKNLHKKILRKE